MIKHVFLLTQFSFILPWLFSAKLNQAPTLVITSSDNQNGFSENFSYSTHGDEVLIYNLDKDGTYVGNSVWFKRKNNHCQVKYFAYDPTGKVSNRYQEFKKTKNIIAAYSGAFSDSQAVPVGITVDNGVIVNRRIDDSMDALVIVYATGGIVVSDIDEGNLNLASLGTIDVRKDADKTKLLSWAEKEKATVFQTQLLAYRNSLRLTRSARTESAARRYLALAKNKEGELFHIMYNIRNDVYLFDSTFDIVKSLKEKEMEIVAVINTDTGSYDCLNLYNSNNDLNRNIGGTIDISTATNLVVHYYE